MILLQLNDISKSFDGEDIFTNVDFEVKTGERIGGLSYSTNDT